MATRSRRTCSAPCRACGAMPWPWSAIAAWAIASDSGPGCFAFSSQPSRRYAHGSRRSGYTNGSRMHWCSCHHCWHTESRNPACCCRERWPLSPSDAVPRVSTSPTIYSISTPIASIRANATDRSPPDCCRCAADCMPAPSCCCAPCCWPRSSASSRRVTAASRTSPPSPVLRRGLSARRCRRGRPGRF